MSLSRMLDTGDSRFSGSAAVATSSNGTRWNDLGGRVLPRSGVFTVTVRNSDHLRLTVRDSSGNTYDSVSWSPVDAELKGLAGYNPPTNVAAHPTVVIQGKSNTYTVWSNPDGSWPNVVAPGEDTCLNLYANLVDMPNATVYPRPPVSAQSPRVMYVGPPVVDSMPTIVASMTRAGMVVSFTATPTLRPSTTATYAWDLRDGFTATGLTASRTYVTTGRKVATVTMTDSDNLVAKSEVTFVVTA